MDPIENLMRMNLVILIVIGIMLDLLCFKWRKLANAFIYLECITRIVALMFPNHANYNYDFIGYMQMLGMTWLFYYCDEPAQLITITVTFGIHLFLGNLLLYL